MKKIIFSILCVFSLNAKSLVVLEPAAVEILLALGAKDDIKAIAKPSSLDIYPIELSTKLDSVGTYIRPNIEKIVALKPDLVIAGHHSVSIKQDLDNFGVKTLLLEANTLNDMKENIKTLSNLVGKKDSGDLMIKELADSIKTIKDERLKGKKVLFIFSSNPLMLFCSNNLANDLIKELDMINVCDKKEQTLIVNMEYILSKNPDYIVYMGNDDGAILQNPMLKHTKAYKNGKTIRISSSKILRASPRVVLVLKELKDEFLK